MYFVNTMLDNRERDYKQDYYTKWFEEACKETKPD